MNEHQQRMAQVASILEATPQTLAVMLAPIDDVILNWRPAPGEWSVKEIIGHLIETDPHAFAGRIRLMLAEERPALPKWDMLGAVAARQDNERTLPALLDELAAGRPDCAALVRSLQPVDLRRPCTHSLGELTIGDFVYEWPYHDHSHLAQIASNIRSFFPQFMGDTMRAAVS